jgi:phage baseplate assembly protein W
VSRSPSELDLLWRRLGRDLRLTFAGPSGTFDDADLATTRVIAGAGGADDIEVVERVDAAEQLLVNRLQTRRGELAPLGHPDYGSRHHELIGQPNTERTRNLVKVHVLECLRHEPRVAEVLRCDITELERHRDVVRITLDLRLVDEAVPLNLVVPFELATAT